MTMGAFQEMAPAWAAAGITPLPITADGKRPLVKQPDAFGSRAALQLATKPRFANAAVGFWCGHFNRLTVVDVDSAADSELQYALDTFGQSPVIVRTASGKHHAYYRHGGERRRIRPIPGHAIDILGEGGLCVAPPSVRPAGGRYEFVRGGLSDLANLPTMQRGTLQEREMALSHEPMPVPWGRSAAIDHGERNDRLFKLVCALAHQAETQDALLLQSREANAALCNPPLSDVEVQGRVRSAWRYKMSDRLMMKGAPSTLILPGESIARLLTAGETDAMAVLAMIHRAHGHRPGKPFALSPEALEAARKIGRWDRKRYRNAIRRAVDLGELAQVHQGGRGKRDPSLYRLPFLGGRFALQS
jgi:Bifunctional DNA primase/polymerase, N-terminal/Primase C terminal 1 (PriCT-1)